MLPSSNPYWRRTKEKYKQTKICNTRYQTQYNICALALVKGHYYYNHKSSYHGCSYRSRNGTRKKIQYNRGEQRVNPIHTSCWRPVKKIYLGFPPRNYLTKYRKKYFKNTRNLFLIQMLDYS